MASFLRIDGDELSLRGGRLVWYAAHAGTIRGLAFHITAFGGRNLLHVSGWAPGEEPDDLSGAELTLDQPGPDAALDGRLFRGIALRFGRVGRERAVISLDGAVAGFDDDSYVHSEIAADIALSVVAAEIPAYCNRCGRSLADEAVAVSQVLAGHVVTSHRPRPTCSACLEASVVGPPERCSTCGVSYEPGGVAWQSDERSLAYTCTCPHGHTVSGTSTIAA